MLVYAGTYTVLLELVFAVGACASGSLRYRLTQLAGMPDMYGTCSWCVTAHVLRLHTAFCRASQGQSQHCGLGVQRKRSTPTALEVRLGWCAAAVVLQGEHGKQGEQPTGSPADARCSGSSLPQMSGQLQSRASLWLWCKLDTLRQCGSCRQR